MALTDTFVKNVKPAGKYWRMSYRYLGKQKTLAIGVYPAVSLAKARKRRDEVRARLWNDRNLARPGDETEAQFLLRVRVANHETN